MKKKKMSLSQKDYLLAAREILELALDLPELNFAQEHDRLRAVLSRFYIEKESKGE